MQLKLSNINFACFKSMLNVNLVCFFIFCLLKNICGIFFIFFKNIFLLLKGKFLDFCIIGVFQLYFFLHALEDFFDYTKNSPKRKRRRKNKRKGKGKKNYKMEIEPNIWQTQTKGEKRKGKRQFLDGIFG